MTATVGATNNAACVLDLSRIGMAGAAAYYRRTDAASAARLDATLPVRVPGPATALQQEWDANPCAPSFSDSREPSGHLKLVDDVEYSHPLAALDNLSISHWALRAFDAVFGFNPLERVTGFFLGDWQAVARAGVAIGRAADGVHDLGFNLQGGANSLHTVWEGEAADAAYDHFTRLAAGVDAMADPMRQISEKFTYIANGVWNACEATTGWIKGMIDAAIIAGIATAAGTATIETGVGAVVGYGVAAIQVTQMLDAWANATKAMSSIYGAVQAAMGFIESQVSRLEGTKLPDLAGSAAYRHPLA